MEIMKEFEPSARGLSMAFEKTEEIPASHVSL